MNKVNKALKQALNKADREYWAEMERLAEIVRQAFVIPFCDKHGLKFLAGNGGWAFYGKAQESTPRRPEKDFSSSVWSGASDLPKTLLEALTMPVMGGQYLGSLCMDYTPTNYEP